jgi:large subunit ribosomal protein L20
MTRVKTPSQKRHRKILKKAKGYRQARSSRLKPAMEAVLHAGQYAYIGRKLRKRDMRKLWVTRLNAAVREHDLIYSKFISMLKDKKIDLDRKILSDIAIKDPETFAKIVEEVKK